MENQLCLHCLTFVIPIYRIHGIHYEELCPNCKTHFRWVSKEEVERKSLTIENDESKEKPLF